MGVSWVFETKESARSVEVSLEQAGAILNEGAKSFKVDCICYKPQITVAGQISSFHLLHHSNFPESSFIIGVPSQMDGSKPSPRATSDQGFDLILGKFSAGLIPEYQTKFELIGNEYFLKDFRVRVGTVSSGSASVVKGVIVEFEYAPSYVVYQCHAILQDVIEIFFPGQTQRKPEILQRQTHQVDNYMAIDTLSQYLDIFLSMRKKA